MSQKSYDNTPTLYLIPTPIGNLDDITVRALKTLESVDFVLCEDTRETGKLLSKYDIKKRLVSCHEFNEDKIRSYVVDELRNGLNIGLVTDQGTPIISDPGYIVAKEVIKAGFNVISLPGATAFVPALTTAGIDPSPFMFYGFLNSKESKKKKELEALAKFKYTMIFYEAPHRIKNTLTNMLEVLGDRYISISREISKKFEEIYYRRNIYVHNNGKANEIYLSKVDVNYRKKVTMNQYLFCDEEYLLDSILITKKMICAMFYELLVAEDADNDIFETLADYAATSRDTDILTEYVRQSLKRAISSKYFGDGDMTSVVTLDPKIEQMIMSSIKQTEQGAYISLDPAVTKKILKSTEIEIQKLENKGQAPIIITSPIVRMYFKKLTNDYFKDLIVISYNEIDSKLWK